MSARGNEELTLYFRNPVTPQSKSTKEKKTGHKKEGDGKVDKNLREKNPAVERGKSLRERLLK